MNQQSAQLDANGRPVMTAVFKTVTQALFVSFLMESQPAGSKCSTQTFIDMLKREAGIVEDLEERDRQIDFGGLSPIEVRGQCAMVIAACLHRLPNPELAAIFTRYGHRRRQAQGIRALRDYCAPSLGQPENEWMQMALLWNLFGPKGRRADFSLVAIASEYGIPRQTLQYKQEKLKKTQRELERRACASLEDYFQRKGLVEIPEKDGSVVKNSA